jgi:hypothetical protein
MKPIDDDVEEDWRSDLARPARDTRIKTEVCSVGGVGLQGGLFPPHTAFLGDAFFCLSRGFFRPPAPWPLPSPRSAAVPWNGP